LYFAIKIVLENKTARQLRDWNDEEMEGWILRKSPDAVSNLQGQSVEWIIEAYNPSSGGGPCLGDCGSVLFTNAEARTSSGEMLGMTRT
jgi:hypothetical protein